jgi:uncharacterized membrane-anchored protein YhcB (DUF1043 family)
MDWLMFLFGIAVGICVLEGFDKLRKRAEKKIQQVEADILREETLKALDKVKEELEKEK